MRHAGRTDRETRADRPIRNSLEEPIEAPGFVAMQASADLSGPASLTLALRTRAVFWSPNPAPRPDRSRAEQ